MYGQKARKEGDNIDVDGIDGNVREVSVDEDTRMTVTTKAAAGPATRFGPAEVASATDSDLGPGTPCSPLSVNHLAKHLGQGGASIFSRAVSVRGK